MQIFKKVNHMIACRVLLILSFGFFTEAAMAGKAYDLLIKFHNTKIKATIIEAIASDNDKIHGILGGSRGFSKNYLTTIEKANTTYIAIHAALTTPGTAENILLDKVFTETNLRHLSTPNPKIITHYVKLAILYLATETAGQTQDSNAFKLLIKAKIGNLADSGRLPMSLRDALIRVTEINITNTLQRLNFGQTYHFIKKQIHKKWHGIPGMELIGNSLPSLTIEECHSEKGKCGERGRWKGMHPHHERPPVMGPFGAPHVGLEGFSPPPPPGMGRHEHRNHHHHGPRPFGSPPGMHGHGLPPPVFDMVRPPPPHHHHGGPPHDHHWKKPWLKEFSAPTTSTTLEADEDDEEE